MIPEFELTLPLSYISLFCVNQEIFVVEIFLYLMPGTKIKLLNYIININMVRGNYS